MTHNAEELDPEIPVDQQVDRLTTAHTADNDALPDHADWDGPCDHRAAWDAVTTHTRTANGIGPDHCEECSAAIREWVPWPCPRVTPSGQGRDA